MAAAVPADLHAIGGRLARSVLGDSHHDARQTTQDARALLDEVRTWRALALELCRAPAPVSAPPEFGSALAELRRFGALAAAPGQEANAR